MPASAPQGPLLRALASSSTARRRAAMLQLSTFLSSSAHMSPTEHLKIWKALFYCLYMTPGVRNHQRLADEMADLALSLQEKESTQLHFLEAFWTTISREWEGVDKVRLDKFLLLVRRMVGATIGGAKAVEQDGYGFEKEKLERYVKILEDGPLKPKDNKVPVGLRLHVLDVLLDEVEKADPEGKMDLEVVLKAVRKLSKESLTKTVKERAKEVLSDERVAAWGKEAQAVERPAVTADGDDWDGLDD